MAENTLETAVFYESLGCSVLPLKPTSKEPSVPWAPYQERRPDRQELVAWFGSGAAGIGIIGGSVSGNLVIRDFDQQTAYETWTATYPDAAHLLPTVATARGAHVYFRTTMALGTRHFDDGELRGNGSYVVAPPSIHPSGIQYRWTHPFRGDDIPVIDPVEVGLIPHETQEVLGGSVGHSCVSQVGELADLVSRAIRRTIPSGPGQRHRMLFEFIRNLKQIRQYQDATAEECYSVFQHWFNTARPHIGTKDFKASWQDFEYGWMHCKYPVGILLAEAAARADEGEVPNRVKGEKLRRLVAICAELQSMHGTMPFFLDCRSAALLLGVSYPTAHRMLVALCDANILRKESTGSFESRKANEYRYLGA